MNALGKAAVGIAVLVELAVLGGGMFLLVQRETGTRARATVTGCVESGGGRYATIDCSGTWVVGGSLVGGNGHVVVGTVQGAAQGDVGKTVDVTVSGDTAYVRSITLPLALIGLGLALPALVAFVALGTRRQRRRRAGAD